MEQFQVLEPEISPKTISHGILRNSFLSSEKLCKHTGRTSSSVSFHHNEYFQVSHMNVKLLIFGVVCKK